MTVVRAEQNELVTGGPAQTNGQVLASSALRQFAADGKAALEIAYSIAPTPFVPTSYKRPNSDEWYPVERIAQNVAAAWLAGDEVGLKPMQALQAIDVIEGRPALNARSMRALVQAHGHEIWIEEQPTTVPEDRSSMAVTIAGRRKDSDHIERVVWTWRRAQQQELSTKKNWRRMPIDMLIARATSAICRLIASDVLMGLAYSQEELQDELESSEEEAPVTVRRASVARRTEPEADPFEGDDDKPEPSEALRTAAAQPRQFTQTDVSVAADSGPGQPHIHAEPSPTGDEPGDPYVSLPEELDEHNQEFIPEQPQEPRGGTPMSELRCEEVAGDGRRCKREAGHENRHYFGPRSEAPAQRPADEHGNVTTRTLGEAMAMQTDEARAAVAEFTPSPEEAAAADEGPDDGLFPDVSEEEQEAAFIAERAERATREAAQAAAGVPAGDPVGEPGGTAGPEDAAPAGDAEDDDPWADFR